MKNLATKTLKREELSTVRGGDFIEWLYKLDAWLSPQGSYKYGMKVVKPTRGPRA